MELIELKANTRHTVGNGPARTLRRQGRLPAVLYGPGIEPVSLSIDAHELEQVLKETPMGQLLLNLVVVNGETVGRSAMVKELQRHPVSGEFIHVDFYEIDMDRKITVRVPVVIQGKSKGVALGGLLQIIRRELEVLCYPNQIPESIDIDVSDLEIGDSVHLQEIPLAEGIEIPTDVNFTVITVLTPKKEEEPEEEELEEEAELEEETEGEPDSEQ